MVSMVMVKRITILVSMALHRTCSFFMLYMIVSSRVQNCGGDLDVWLFTWNFYTNCHCANAVSPLKNCRFVVFCGLWVCWFCPNTGFWSCNQVFDYYDDVVFSMLKLLYSFSLYNFFPQGFSWQGFLRRQGLWLITYLVFIFISRLHQACCLFVWLQNVCKL